MKSETSTSALPSETREEQIARITAVMSQDEEYIASHLARPAPEVGAREVGAPEVGAPETAPTTRALADELLERAREARRNADHWVGVGVAQGELVDACNGTGKAV